MRKRRTVVTLVVSLMSVLLMTAGDVETFVNCQLKAYPQSRLLDLYKSCFQDYMGAEHLVPDRETVNSYLYAEIDGVAADDLLPWYYEPCGTDGNYFRVSLRCVKEGILDIEALLDAFIRSANAANRPSVDAWLNRWNEIITIIDSMNPDLKNYAGDKQFIEEILQQGHYAISHSPEYREAYNPHYRIVERGIFEAEILPLIQAAGH